MTDAAPELPAPPSPFAARPRRRWLARGLTLLLLLALAGTAYWLLQRAKTPAGSGSGFGGPGAPGGPGGPGGPGVAGGPGGGGVTVGIARAMPGQLPVVVDALGTVTPPVTAALVPQVSGVLTQVLFREGQLVRKDQVLARIDARSYEQALAQARAQSAKDLAQLESARVTLARYRTLLEEDSIARQNVDTQAALVQQLEAALLADRAAERSAQLNVDFTAIRAPITGVIGLRAVDPGNLVGSNTTGGIATITQVNPIDVVFSVPQDRIPAVLAAQRAGKLPVSALDRARTRTLASGTLLTLDNQINTATGTVRAKARFDNADLALFPNQFVNARLLLGHGSGVLVPLTALRTGPQGDYVYVVDDERVAHMRAVTRGIATAEQVLIASGLEPGERVVAEGGDRVKDGARVQLAAPGGSASAAGGGARGASAPAAGSASAPTASHAGAAAPGSAAAPGAAASTPAEGRPPWLERLPPEQRDKLLALPPEERRAYLQKLREAREAGSGPSGR